MLIIHCPACAVGLQLPRAVLAKRARRICCAICEHRWVEAPVINQDHVARDSAGLASPTPPSAPEISLLAQSGRSQTSSDAAGSDTGETAGADEPQDGAKAKARRALPRIWPRSLPRRVAAGAMLALALVSVMKRDVVVRVAPPLAGAFAAIGLPVNLLGLQWREVKTRVVMEPTQRVLAVEGEIKNLRDHTQALPEIQLSLRDDDGREVYTWTQPAPKADIDRGETIQFQARLASPPAGAKAVRVYFADAELAAR